MIASLMMYARPEVADATGAETVPQLQACLTFGQKCKLCHPYARRMLRTGQTVFHQIVTEADDPEAGPRPPAHLGAEVEGAG